MAKQPLDGLADPNFTLGDMHRAEALMARGVDPYSGELSSNVFILGIQSPRSSSTSSSTSPALSDQNPPSNVRILKQIIRAPFWPKQRGEHVGSHEYKQRLGRLRKAGYSVPAYSHLPLPDVRGLYARIAHEISLLT